MTIGCVGSFSKTYLKSSSSTLASLWVSTMKRCSAISTFICKIYNKLCSLNAGFRSVVKAEKGVSVFGQTINFILARFRQPVYALSSFSVTRRTHCKLSRIKSFCLSLLLADCWENVLIRLVLSIQEDLQICIWSKSVNQGWRRLLQSCTFHQVTPALS